MTLIFENEGNYELGFDPEALARQVIDQVLDMEQCPYEAEAELILTDPENIRRMNREFRGIDRETDVRGIAPWGYCNLGSESRGTGGRIRSQPAEGIRVFDRPQHAASPGV